MQIELFVLLLSARKISSRRFTRIAQIKDMIGFWLALEKKVHVELCRVYYFFCIFLRISAGSARNCILHACYNSHLTQIYADCADLEPVKIAVIIKPVCYPPQEGEYKGEDSCRKVLLTVDLS